MRLELRSIGIVAWGWMLFVAFFLISFSIYERWGKLLAVLAWVLMCILYATVWGILARRRHYCPKCGSMFWRYRTSCPNCGEHFPLYPSCAHRKQ